MTQMLSFKMSSQRPSRSWFWEARRRAGATPDNAAAKTAPREPVEPIEVKQANWPRQRATWMPPLT